MNLQGGGGSIQLRNLSVSTLCLTSYVACKTILKEKIDILGSKRYLFREEFDFTGSKKEKNRTMAIMRYTKKNSTSKPICRVSHVATKLMVGGKIDLSLTIINTKGIELVKF